MDPQRTARIGVLAVQGAVREHVAAIREIGAEPVEVRLPRDLVDLDALILPGGESTTMRRLLDGYGLREPIAALARAGAPLFGTCAGMILLADRLDDEEDPYFGMLDLEVRRNGYGRQLDSFEADLDAPSLGEPPTSRRLHPRPVGDRCGSRGRGAGARPGREPRRRAPGPGAGDGIPSGAHE